MFPFNFFYIRPIFMALHRFITKAFPAKFEVKHQQCDQHSQDTSWPRRDFYNKLLESAAISEKKHQNPC